MWLSAPYSRRCVLLLVVFLLAATVASAQPAPIDRWTPALPNENARGLADAVSYATVIVPLAADAYAAWKGPDPRHDLALAGVRAFTVWGIASIAKGLTHRERPCHYKKYFTGATETALCSPDDPYTSFFSMHTALAFSTLGGPRIAISVPFAVSTGGLRLAAGKHWFTDVLAGAAVGSLVSRIR